MSESVLIIDGGGRGDAYLEGFVSADPDLEVFHTPDLGMAGRFEQSKGLEIALNDHAELIRFAKQKNSLVVVGPEAPLVAGLADQMRDEGLLVLGHSEEGAQWEGSKWFAIEQMQEAGLPVPISYRVDNMADAEVFITHWDRYVYKADGLAGGKGVVLAESEQEARETMHGFLSGEMHKGAGRVTVIQERLPEEGDEISVMILFDGKNYIKLDPSQDHKRLKDADQLEEGETNPNTGGMGAYSPLDWLTEKDQEQIDDIADKLVQQHIKSGMTEPGIIYAGLMKDVRDDQFKVLEINVRGGDPEVEVVVPRITARSNVNFYELIRSAASGELAYTQEEFDRMVGREAFLAFCLASPGYPNSPTTGQQIHGLEKPYRNVSINYAAVEMTQRGPLTAGGRDLYVIGRGSTVPEAREHGLAAIGKDKGGIYIADGQGKDVTVYRKGIGARARKN